MVVFGLTEVLEVATYEMEVHELDEEGEAMVIGLHASAQRAAQRSHQRNTAIALQEARRLARQVARESTVRKGRRVASSRMEAVGLPSEESNFSRESSTMAAGAKVGNDEVGDKPQGLCPSSSTTASDFSPGAGASPGQISGTRSSTKASDFSFQVGALVADDNMGAKTQALSPSRSAMGIDLSLQELASVEDDDVGQKPLEAQGVESRSNLRKLTRPLSSVLHRIRGHSSRVLPEHTDDQEQDRARRGNMRGLNRAQQVFQPSRDVTRKNFLFRWRTRLNHASADSFDNMFPSLRDADTGCEGDDNDSTLLETGASSDAQDVPRRSSTRSPSLRSSWNVRISHSKLVDRIRRFAS
eukprot:TRINITY_DN9992_c0_g1_i1.p1 TRINITY_DN9992_c0_g1~~TRINITY_DN9992_c0_g1_i1.p1  ORF type:complete len:381 (-),score=34.65 TRINITY_DN9992_c0_g1_i1:527-1594(-)